MVLIKEEYLETNRKTRFQIKGLWIAMKKKKLKADKAQAVQNPEENTIKEITPKKLRKKRYILLYLAVIGFAFYAVITIINQSVQIADKKAELKDLQQQISVVEIQTKYLEKVQDYEGEELSEYIQKIAKEDFGYISEGERIFINVAGD